MENIPDELVEYLVDEIGLNGCLGSTVQDVHSYLEKYSRRNENQIQSRLPTAAKSQDGLFNRDFLTHLWIDLLSHPDITLKRQREYDESTQPMSGATQQTPVAASKSSLDPLNPSPARQASIQPQHDSLTKKATLLEEVAVWISTSKKDRVYTARPRSFRLICRHAEDRKKVSNAEFGLLSIIGVSRENGVLQLDLDAAAQHDESFLNEVMMQFERDGYVRQKGIARSPLSKRWVLSRFENAVEISAQLGQGDRETADRTFTTSEQQPAKHDNNTEAEVVSCQPQDMESTQLPESTLLVPIFHNQVTKIAEVVDDANASAAQAHASVDQGGGSSEDESATAMDWIPDQESRSPSVEAPSQVSAQGRKLKRKGFSKRLGRPKMKPKGRPRKFVRGTELFWQDQFLLARREKDPEMKHLGKAGVMLHPAGLELFNQKPENFDDILVRSIEAGLPVPEFPTDITQQWVDKTLAILDRTQIGLYVSPRGELPNKAKRVKHLSQVLILRSPRLREVDFTNHCIIAKVRFLTSNAAHTLHYQRYYPKIPRERPSYVSFCDISKSDDAQINSPEKSETPLVTKEPKARIQFEHFPSSPTHVQTSMSNFSVSETPNRKRKNSDIDAKLSKRPRARRKRGPSVVDLDELPETQTKGPRSAEYKLVTIVPVTPNPYGLPPPLTTRGARRRHDAVQQRQLLEQPMLVQSLRYSVQDDVSGQWNLMHTKTPPGQRPLSSFWKPPNTVADAPFPQDEVLMDTHGGQESDSDYDEPPSKPQDRVRWGGRGGNVGRLRRNIILEIVDYCSGAIPYNHSCPMHAFVRKWHDAGQETPVDERTLKTAIKSLCDGGRLKQMSFSMRARKGNMVVRKILTQPGIAGTHPLIGKLQRTIEDAHPHDYVPQALEDDDRGFETRKSTLKNVVDHTPDLPPKPKKEVTVLTLKINSKIGLQSYRNTVAAARSRRRNKRKAAWVQGSGGQPLPESLADIVRDDEQPSPDHSRATDSILSRFEWEVDAVEMWELRTFSLVRADTSYSNFIDHSIALQKSPGFRQTRPFQFADLEWFDEQGKKTAYPFPETPLPDLYNDPFVEEESVEEAPSPPRKRPKKLAGTSTPLTDRYTYPSPNRAKQKRPFRASNTLSGIERPTYFRGIKNNKANRKPQPSYIVDGEGNLIDVSRGTEDHITPVRRARGPQALKNMTDADIYHIAVAIVVVRTLAGGLEKYIDWPIIMRLFPDEDEQFVKDRWKTLANRYRRDVAGLTESLQERYLDAFERGQVPGVDFEDLGEGTNWKEICEWAVENLDGGGVSGIEELPSSGGRNGWVAKKEFTFEESKGLRELLGYNVNATNPRKEEAMGGLIFARPFIDVDADCRQVEVRMTMPAEEEERDDSDLARARSWVFATVLTSPTQYDEYRIRTKLMKLAPQTTQVEELTERALRVLQRDRIIARNRETKIAGIMEGGWEASVKLYEYFDQKRMVTKTMLREAAAWKVEVLDPQILVNGKAVVDKMEIFEDGEMVALLNLVAGSRVRLHPADDVPNTRYGLEWQTNGYQTRLLDKACLAFSIIIEATEDYVLSDPMQEQRALPIPRGEIDDIEKGRIPMWLDVLGNFQVEIWEMVLAAVVGLVSVRASIGVVEIRRTLGHGISAWELEMVLGWAEEGGFVRRTGGSGWVTEEWWWLILGARSDWAV